MDLLNKIDNLFLESDISIRRVEVKIIEGIDIDSLKYPAPSFVGTGFCLIILHTDNGLVGIGEPSPYGGSIVDTANALKKISENIINRPIYNTWCVDNDSTFSFDEGYGNLAKQAVIAALSQCCLDILSKQMSRPIFKILNPESGNTVQAYASGGMIYDYQSLDLYVEEALYCQKQGFKAWKFRPSTPRDLDHFQRNNTPPAIDLNAVKETIKNVSSEVEEDFEILLDLGCRCKNISEAIELANFSLEYNVGFIEEPLLRNMESYKGLIKNTETKISFGETFFSALQFKKWVENSAVDVFQPDMNLAGMREGIKILSIAKKYNRKIILHNWANPISNLANLNFAVAFNEECCCVENSIVYNPFRDSLIENNISPSEGVFYLGDLDPEGFSLV